MSNNEKAPAEEVCRAEDGPEFEVLVPRDVPLGGPRAMLVKRALPSRQRSLIGAWCFVDHYGPDRVADTGGMEVAPHPHTGLQTVSWLFTGEIEHRDSIGTLGMVRPGEINLMTAGRGISHSEVSTPDTEVLHGVQLWVALPDAARHTDPAFEFHAPEPITGPGWRARVFLGSLLGDTSPVTTFTPLLGAELELEPGTSVELDLDPTFEIGLLVDRGSVATGFGDVERYELGYFAPGNTSLTVTAGDEATRIVLLGGPPFGEEIMMWWNFVGRTHEEIVGYREEWQAQITDASGAALSDGQDVTDGRFGIVREQHLPPIPAPVLPNIRLRPRH